jgi:hypothetical protein
MNGKRNNLAILIFLILCVPIGCKMPSNVTQVPNQLVGNWGRGNTSLITYQDPNTGSYSDPSGTQSSYKIMGDGSYEYAILMSKSVYNCTTKITSYQTGYVQLNGSNITFVPTDGKLTSQDSCNPKYNYEKPDLEQTTYGWSVVRDQNGEQMCLQNNLGTICYKRE